MRGSRVVVEMLKAHGVRHIFGVPGDTSTAFYDALYDARGSIRHIMARDERSAAFMADAYARVSGQPGVCEGPSGGGLTYMLPGLAEAHGSSIPLVALTTDVPLHEEGRGALTALDQCSLASPVSKGSEQVKNATKLSESIRRAFRLATTGRPGVAHLSLPADVLEQETEPPSLDAVSTSRVCPACRATTHDASIREALTSLLNAKRPAMVAGGGVLLSQAWDALTELAELLQVPVATTINGKGSIAETHPLSLGVIGENGGRQHANRAVQEADLVFCIGSRLNSVTTCRRSLIRPAASIIQLDVDPAQIGNNYPVEVGMAGDARATLRKMLDLARSSANGDDRRPASWLRRVQADGQQWWSAQEKALAESTPLSPRRLVSQLERLLGDDAVIVADPGTPTPWVAALYRVRRAGRSVVIPRAHGGLGYAIPGALGAKLARPEATVVGISGDGSFGMSVGELETLSRVGAPVTIILLNNRCFGWIKALQHFHCADRYLSVDFNPDVDPVEIARGFGLNAWRLESMDDLPEIMHQAWEGRKPAFIDAPCPSEVDEVPPVASWVQKSRSRP